MKNKICFILIIVFVLSFVGCAESDISKWNKLNEEFGQLQTDHKALIPLSESITSTDDLAELEAVLAEFDNTSDEIITRAEELETELAQFSDSIEPDIYNENLEVANDVITQMKLIRLSADFIGEYRIWGKKDSAANPALERLELANSFLTELSDLEEGLDALGFSPEYEHYQSLKGSLEVARDEVMRTIASLSE